MLKSTKDRPGWLAPYLAGLDAMFFNRWGYWQDAVIHDRIPEEPIPMIDFDAANAYAKKETQKNLNSCLDYASHETSSVLEKFVDWILWGIGCKRDTSFPNISEKIDDHWYRTFNLGLFYVEPADHWAEIAQEYHVGEGSGFFATPMPVVKLMTQITMSSSPKHAHKSKSVMDPCCGTGSMLLAASNYSLNLYANDVHPLIYKMMLLNAYIYIPWMIYRPMHLTMFSRPEMHRLAIPDGMIIPVCDACKNDHDFYTDVESDVNLEMHSGGFLDIEIPDVDDIGKRIFTCAECTSLKEKTNADTLPEV
jgi:hypothetical protein